MIALSPKFANINETALNIIAQALYLGPFGNIAANVSEQLVISPTAVLRQASVTVAARTKSPGLPR